MTHVSIASIEAIAAESYAEFYNQKDIAGNMPNAELFQRDPQKYWFFAIRYKEAKLHEKIYMYNNTVKKDYDPTEDMYLDSSEYYPRTRSNHKLLSLLLALYVVMK